MKMHSMHPTSPYSDAIKNIVKCIIPTSLFAFLFIVLVWDLHRVKELSDTIHDDHADIWVPMNISDLSKWYSPSDVCILQKELQSSKLVDSVNKNKQSISSDCSKLLQNTITPLKFKCSIGSSVGNRQCLSPYLPKIFYLQHLINTKKYDSSQTVMKRILYRLADYQKPLIFIGDVISKQNLDAFLCESLRSDRTWITSAPINVIRVFNNSNSSLTGYTVRWKSKPQTVNIYFLHMTHVLLNPSNGAASHDSAYDHDANYHFENSDSYNVKDPGFLRQAKNARRRRSIELKLNISDQQAPSIKDGSVMTTAAPNSLDYPKVATSLNVHHIKQYLEIMNATYGGYIIIANIGVWYNTRERFRSEIPLLLQLLNKVGQSNLVLYRETAAQHWNLTNHGYFSNGGDPAEGGCHPLVDASPEYDWRNRDVRIIIENENFNNINIIPFRDITAALWTMHPDDREMKDCTRFCYLPQLWQMVWHYLDAELHNTTKFIRKE